ncbi:prolipoprotein diacylglyceryl transferase family protein [Pseudomonas sp. Pseusp122]|uniref:prolipoprotein diacylglyceryl transferase family protein n=1 Tax=unclassified Pseudomonas TaxID=196821 RepID=UPI0039A45E98
MLSIAIGPFALAVNHLLLLLALGVSSVVAWWNARRTGGSNPESVQFSLFLLGLLVARLAFVITYWSQYRDNPWQTVDIRDGGFLAWAGVLTIIVGGCLYGWRRAGSRRPLALGVASGLLFWLLAQLTLTFYQQGAALPDLTLRNAAGEPVRLADYKGRPLVINLWATWCPPCRREMPVLQAAQQQRDDVLFLFVNQAESPKTVADFLNTQGLTLDHMLFDDDGELAQQVGAMALPSTLFYSAEGRLQGSHLGELSNASLTRALESVTGSAAAVSSSPRTTP